MEKIFVARQPIYDRQLRVFAYELLYRSGGVNQANVIDGDRATSEVVVNSFLDIGLNSIVGDRPAFINMTDGFLTGAFPLPNMSQQIVLEVLETVSPSREIIEGLKALAASGYLIALDDFVFREELEPLLRIAHIVKLDILALGAVGVNEQLVRLRDYPVKLLAEKVETHDQLARCQALGFDYFQGYFFSRPHIVAGQRPQGNRLVILELLTKLQNPTIDADELEKLIALDVSIAYRLLRYINSAFFGLRSTVTSIKHALTLLGPVAVRQWASLILMVRLGDSKVPELLITGMVRAKMCELIGVQGSEYSGDQYFTVGLFSILDALMDLSLPEILNALPLSADTENALANYSGPLGVCLRNVLNYERGHWDRLDNSVGNSLQNAYLGALRWASDSQQALSS